MGNIKGTPDYWKKFLFDVLAIAKPLGLPTSYMNLKVLFVLQMSNFLF